MVFNIGEKNTIANQFLAELRDKLIQQDRLRFRRNMERLGEIMAYEISQRLSYREKMVNTPLGKSPLFIPEPPVLITILRAGLPYYHGFQHFFDGADSGFIGAYRKEGEADVQINLDYQAAPSVSGRTVIIIDPMLATGKSALRSIHELLKNGTPAHIHIASLLAAPEGIAHLKKEINLPYSIWTFAIDERLNDQFYIVPGLGDAGDLSFGEKM
ncbi:MAG: uracil phosphoribosyltransferase [Cytophaga sp.]|nr:uracil phosphoribosyltransferase [Cytophaga sp.]